MNENEKDLNNEENAKENIVNQPEKEEVEVVNENSLEVNNIETNKEEQKESDIKYIDEIETDLSGYKNIFSDNKEKKKEYEWDYEKYSKMDQLSKNKSSKNKGAVVFTSILCAIVAIFIITFGSIKFSNWVSEVVFNKHGSSQTDGDGGVKLKIASKGEADSIIDKNSYIIPTLSSSPATQIAKKVIPSVVSVVPYARVQSFYQTGITEIGSASGIIMNSNGYIITNSHVVLKLPTIELVDAVKVILSDDREFEAKIIGVDLNTDLAVLKIDANNLPAAEFGDSNLLEVGEQVFAIGNPTGLEFAGSMTSGIVSALNRTTPNTSTLGCDNKYIQTDAAINPGNSGGALVNMNGQVIGINSSKFANIAVEGMGFSIPISQVKPVLDDLVNYGRVKGRVKLGIIINREIDDILAKLNDMKTGLLIESVEGNPDLASKGIKQYDILHEFDGIKVCSVQELKEQLRKHKPNDIVHIVFYRYDQFNNNEQKIDIDVKLMEDEGIVNAK